MYFYDRYTFYVRILLNIDSYKYRYRYCIDTVSKQDRKKKKAHRKKKQQTKNEIKKKTKKTTATYLKPCFFMKEHFK